MVHEFTQVYGGQQNIWTNFDPRVKLAVILTALIGIISTHNFILPLTIIGFVTVYLIWMRVNMKVLLFRLGIPLLIALVLGISQLFLYGHTVFYAWSLGPVELNLYREGLWHGLLLASRVMAGAALLLFLTMTTTMEKVIYSLRAFKVPVAIIEIITVAYRYIFVFGEEMARVRKAQRIRLGYESWTKTIRAVAGMGGILFLRAFDRSERLCRSMIGRGYKGTMDVTSSGEMTAPIGFTSLALGVCLIILVFLAV